MESKNYYLINLNTRRSSVATHLRRDNYMLEPNGCVFLGELTSELVLKYMKYNFLKIQLRVLTQDIAEKVLNRCVNCTEEIRQKVLKGKEHNQEIKHEEPKQVVQNEEEEFVSELEHQETPVVVSEQKKARDVVAAEVVSHDRDEQLSQELKKEATPQEEEHKTLASDEAMFKSVDEVIETTNVINTEQPQEIDIVSENKRQDLLNMNYDELLDLAKANGLKSKGRPSRDKLVDFLSNN